MTDRMCPDCGGEWLRNFVFRHDPRNCEIRAADDATQAADHERLNWAREVVRPSTDTEIILVATMSDTPVSTAEAVTTVTRTATGVHNRVVAGINPDYPKEA